MVFVLSLLKGYLFWGFFNNQGVDMLLLLSCVLTFVYLFGDWMKRQRSLYYALLYLLGGAGVRWFDSPSLEFLSSGLLPLALFVVVMFTGVLGKKVPGKKTLLKVRKELSLAGVILITPHAILHILREEARLAGIVAYGFMIPIFFVSLETIKRGIPYKDWKNIQRLSYGVYGAIFLHVIAVGEYPAKLYYLPLFILYIYTQCYRFWKENSHENH